DPCSLSRLQEGVSASSPPPPRIFLVSANGGKVLLPALVFHRIPSADDSLELLRNGGGGTTSLVTSGVFDGITRQGGLSKSKWNHKAPNATPSTSAQARVQRRRYVSRQPTRHTYNPLLFSHLDHEPLLMATHTKNMHTLNTKHTHQSHHPHNLNSIPRVRSRNARVGAALINRDVEEPMFFSVRALYGRCVY
ncbi:hypothetical protein BDQ17DRAFT_1367623, partial [Cyathus striatus]